MDVIIPTNLVCVLFDPAIPTSSFNFIQLFLYLYNIRMLKSEILTLRLLDVLKLWSQLESEFH